mmetsp:Transcript_38298/g.91779  ORF Transcript_38298/g.91779 Transcript_38298/m.91779 type:complete len:305 (+) Transcript_38298:206-1120(+)
MARGDLHAGRPRPGTRHHTGATRLELEALVCLLQTPRAQVALATRHPLARRGGAPPRERHLGGRADVDLRTNEAPQGQVPTRGRAPLRQAEAALPTQRAGHPTRRPRRAHLARHHPAAPHPRGETRPRADAQVQPRDRARELRARARHPNVTRAHLPDPHDPRRARDPQRRQAVAVDDHLRPQRAHRLPRAIAMRLPQGRGRTRRGQVGQRQDVLLLAQVDHRRRAGAPRDRRPAPAPQEGRLRHPHARPLQGGLLRHEMGQQPHLAAFRPGGGHQRGLGPRPVGDPRRRQARRPTHHAAILRA